MGTFALADANVVGVVECLSNSRVNVDHHVAVCCNFGVPLVDLRLDEVGEIRANSGIDEIHQKLLRKMCEILLLG